MVWTSPATPVSGSVITVSFFNTNVRDNLNWLRLMTGNADPPGTNYVCVSTTTSSVTWQKIPGDAIAVGTIQSNHLGAQQIVMPLIQRQPANTVLRGNGGAADVLFGPVQLADIVVGPGSQVIGSDGSSVVYTQITGAMIATSTITSNKIGAQQIIMPLVERHASNTVLRGNGAGVDVEFGQVQLADMVVGPGSTLIGSNGTSNVHTQITGAMIATGTITSNKIGAEQIVMTLIQRQTANTVMRGNGAGADVSFGQIVAADLATAVSAGLTPSGLIAGFETAAAIPSGWTRYTAADGRLLVGAGAAGTPAMSNPQTFTQATNYGSDWSHGHTNGSLQSPAGTTEGPSTTFNAGAGGTAVGTQNHTHNYLAAALTGAMGGTVWLPALRAIVWAIRS